MFIQILNWEKYQNRKTKQSPRWFQFPNDMMEDHRIWGLSSAEFRVWICILCHTSRFGAGGQSYQDCTKVAKFVRSTGGRVRSVILKLEQLQLLNKNESPLKEKKRKEKKRKGKSAALFFVKKLGEWWNQSGLTQVNILEEVPFSWQKKAEYLESLDKDDAYWIKTVETIKGSAFLTGSKGFTATFDWLLKPDTHLKVASGQYGGGGTAVKKIENAWLHAELTKPEGDDSSDS